MGINVFQLDDAMNKYGNGLLKLNIKKEFPNLRAGYGSLMRKREEAYAEYLKEFHLGTDSADKFNAVHPLEAAQTYTIDDGICNKERDKVAVSTGTLRFPVSDKTETDELYISFWLESCSCCSPGRNEAFEKLGFTVDGDTFYKSASSIEGLLADIDRVLAARKAVHDLEVQQAQTFGLRLKESMASTEWNRLPE